MRTLKHAVSALSLGALVLVAPRIAEAQQRGFALDRFDPSERGSEWFVLDSLDLRGKLRPAAGLVGAFAYKPLVVYNADDSERGAIIEHQVTGHAGASLVALDRLRAGFDLPVALYQTGDSPSVTNVRTRSPGTALGDLRLSADVRLFGEHGQAFNSALGVAVYLPTGDRDEYTSDGNVRVAPRASVAGDVELVRGEIAFSYAGRVGFAYRPLTEAVTVNRLGSELDLAASVGLRLVGKKLLVGPEFSGSSVTNDGSFLRKRTTPIEWLLGAHYTAGDLRFGAGVGAGLSRGWGAPAFRGLLSAEWTPAFDDDPDHDGVAGREDACPTVAGVRTSDPATNGCPPPPAPPRRSDRDRDGVADDVDACPDLAGVATGDPKTNGCPPDRDGDSIHDAADACPDLAGVATGDPKTNGCPPDRDGDGVADSVDACPDVPGVTSEDPKKNGCPSDRDDDGIADGEDACPDAPGPADPDPTRNGCPLARIEDNQVRISQQVLFKTGSATILRESDPVLLAVAAILKDHPELAKIRVEGHTDSRGAAAYNKRLSEQRAAAVAKWLSSYGIDKKRLASKGLGAERPIDSNETDEGRQNNRRVEFHIEAPSNEQKAETPKPPAAKAGPPPDPKAPDRR